MSERGRISRHRDGDPSCGGGTLVSPVPVQKLAPRPRADGVDAFIARLQTLVRTHPHQFLVAVRDETLYTVSAHRGALAPFVRTGLPAHEVGALVAAQPVKRTTYAYFEPRDPPPFVGHCVDLARVRVRHMLGRS